MVLSMLSTGGRNYLDFLESNLIIVWLDAHGRINHLNKFAEEYFGFKEEEIYGKSAIGTIVPENESTGRELSAVIEGILVPHDTCGENENIRKDKTRVWVRWHNMAVRDDRGKLAKLICIGIDVTDKKKSEAELIASQERNRRAQEVAQVGIWSFDLKTGKYWGSDVALKIFGFPLDGVLLSPERVYSCVADKERVHQALVDLIENGKEYNLVYEITPFGQTKKRDVWSSAELEKNSAGEIVGVNGIVQDITERKMIEREMNKLVNLESLGTLAGGIAHDFNNLLTVIMGNASLIRMADAQLEALSKLPAEIKQNLRLGPQKLGALSEESGPLFQRPDLGWEKYDLLLCKLRKDLGSAASFIQEAGSKAAELARQLITFAKGEKPTIRTASLSQVVKDVMDNPLCKSHIHNRSIDLAADLWRVGIDEDQIKQVLQNVFMNAKQAMPDGGTVSIEAKNVINPPELRVGRYVFVSIGDTGVGIPKENIHKVFDPYFTTRAVRARGDGLGLAVCHSIIEKHGGRIYIDSEEGNGTTVSFYLPAEEFCTAKETRADERQTPGKAKRRILVMDDYEMQLLLLKQMLERKGYIVATARNGEEAVVLYRRAIQSDMPFDAVILDLDTGGQMGGEEALNRIKEFDPEVLAVVSSGDSDAIPPGFKAALPKPFDMAELMGLMESIFQ